MQASVILRTSLSCVFSFNQFSTLNCHGKVSKTLLAHLRKEDLDVHNSTPRSNMILPAFHLDPGDTRRKGIGPGKLFYRVLRKVPGVGLPPLLQMKLGIMHVHRLEMWWRISQLYLSISEEIIDLWFVYAIIFISYIFNRQYISS